MGLISSMVAALAALVAAPLPEAADPTARVDALFREFDRSDVPGCALGVYRDGRIEYARGYGMANLELGVANTPQTVFDIGSTSKQFTAFAIQLLAREGRLSLDDDIRTWVPEIPSYGNTVTIRHLLHHTGGLRDYIELMSLQGVMTEDLTGDDDVLAIMALQKAPNFPPGEEYLYSNTGYFLLSVVVKRASGLSLREFAAERIFAPLGMRHTQFNDSHTRVIPGRATGYAKGRDGRFGIDMSDWEQTGDGAVLTTVEDLQRWDRNFYDPKVGDAKLLEEMHVTGVLNGGKAIDYASALRISKYRGLPTVSHGGSWAGYRAQLLRFPAQRFSVACLCNNGGAADPTRLAQQVAEVYLGDSMTKGEPTAAPGAKPAEKRAAVPVGGLRKLAGAYWSRQSGQLATLTVGQDALSARIGGKEYTLAPVAPNRFRLEGGSAGARKEAEFETSGAGRPRMRVVTVREEGDEIETEIFEPAERWSPGAAELAGFAGRYASPELETSWRFVAEGGKLFLRHRGMPETQLEPAVADTFTLEGMTLTFRRDAAGRPFGFTLDVGRVRGVGFSKQL